VEKTGRNHDLWSFWAKSVVAEQRPARLPEQTVHSRFQPKFLETRELFAIVCNWAANQPLLGHNLFEELTFN
jgi:hypothetical protein